MENEYLEHEVKILDINVDEVTKSLENLGAKKVYDDYRIITTLDTDERSFLLKQDKLIRITEEGSIKVTMHINNSNPDIKRGIKYKVSRLKEQKDFFEEMGIKPISRVKARRISYELGEVDFDLDLFPTIPPFMEIDIENLDIELSELLEKLNLKDKKLVKMGTEAIHMLYNVDYFDVYKIEK